MTLVDTSIWVAHFRKRDSQLDELLRGGNILCHSFVIGELACGNLGNRDEILSLLNKLPRAPQAEDAEVLSLIERHQLMGTGLGWVDVHLLASALLAKVTLLTRDKALQKVSGQLSILFASTSHIFIPQS